MYSSHFLFKSVIGECLGGFGNSNRCANNDEFLEFNEVFLSDNTTNQTISISTIDSLYPGLVSPYIGQFYESSVVCSSHTHYSPMFDCDKPKLGSFAGKSFLGFISEHQRRVKNHFSVSNFDIKVYSVGVPVYRRLDYPANHLNKILSRSGKMFPNPAQTVDRSIYVITFYSKETPVFAIALHCCHPVSRTSRYASSSDYVSVLRKGLRDINGNIPILFFQGASGDIRPNITTSIIPSLDFIGYNRKFKKCISHLDQQSVDQTYQASLGHPLIASDIYNYSLALFHQDMHVAGLGDISIPVIVIGDILKFTFLPFEVSHLYHLSRIKEDPFDLLVSCAGDCRGYLVHPAQVSFGGYEVNGSLPLMNQTSPLYTFNLQS